MQCDRCGDTIDPGEERLHNSEKLCDDCYMDVLSPTRICDPWAVRHAKACSNDETNLTAIQQNIIKILADTGGITMNNLATRLSIKEKELERNLAALRHMEKIKARPENGQKVFCLW